MRPSSGADNGAAQYRRSGRGAGIAMGCRRLYSSCLWRLPQFSDLRNSWRAFPDQPDIAGTDPDHIDDDRSEEHTSELQSLMRISYAVFCFKQIKTTTLTPPYTHK